MEFAQEIDVAPQSSILMRISASMLNFFLFLHTSFSSEV